MTQPAEPPALAARLRDAFRTPGDWLARLVDLALVLACVVQPPRTFPDTSSYLANAVYRPPAYPLLLDLTSLFGSLHLSATVAVQAVLGVVTAHLLAGELATWLGVRKTGQRVMAVVLAVPQLMAAPQILSESLTLSLFFLWARATLRLLRAPGLPGLVGSAGWLAAALLARQQLMFAGLTALAVAALAGLRGDRRLAGWLAAAAVAGFGAATTGQAVYGTLLHGDPARVPHTGIHLLTVAIYDLQPDAVPKLADPQDERFLADVVAGSRARKLLRVDVANPSRSHFQTSYDDILYLVMIPRYEAGLGHRMATAQEWRALDKQTLGIALRLLTARPLAYVRHVGVELKNNVLWPLAFAFGLLLLAGLRYWRTRQREWLVFVLAATAMIGNDLLVALIQSFFLRYLLYTDVLLLVVALAGLLRPPRNEPPSEFEAPLAGASGSIGPA